MDNKFSVSIGIVMHLEHGGWSLVFTRRLYKSGLVMIA